MVVLVAIVALVAGASLLFYFSTDRLSQFGGKPSGASLERILASPQYNGRSFVNRHDAELSFTVTESLALFKEFFFGTDRSPKIEIPVNRLNRADFERPSAGEMAVTWLGHSTVLIEIEGRVILTDPVWSERASPSSIFGPKRFHDVPLRLSDLPGIDAVIISHDHYDHLDKKTVIELAESGTMFVTTLGVGAHLETWGIDPAQIVELDWWEEYSPRDDLGLVCTPAQHFSGRGRFGGRNKTLWSTWAIIGREHRVFFCGDTGEMPEFKDIGDKLGPFDLTLMKIGAYGDMWPDLHLTPEQSVRMHGLLHGRVFLPIHWCTFDLALHDWEDPIARLMSIQAADDSLTVVTPIPGERITVDSLPEGRNWWVAHSSS